MTWQEGRWVIVSAVGVFLLLLLTVNTSTSSADRTPTVELKPSSGAGRTGHDRSAETDDSSSKSSTPNADAFTSGSGAYMDDREKQLYERDPTSRGYTDADRDFLKEHGVSEDEARAAETILHQQGIE